VVRRVEDAVHATSVGVEFLDPGHDFLIQVEEHLPQLRSRSTEALRPDWAGQSFDSEVG
jgi:hypothetical protein